MFLTALECAAFGGSLLSVWAYGFRGVWGPLAGLATSCLFVAFGLLADLPAAIVVNIIFVFLHARNYALRHREG